MFAAKEHKEHKDKKFCLWVLCVLLWPFALVAASAALCISWFNGIVPAQGRSDSQFKMRIVFPLLRSVRSFVARMFDANFTD